MELDSFLMMLDDYLDLMKLDKRAIKVDQSGLDKDYIFAAIERIKTWVEGERNLYIKLINNGVEK